MNKNTFRKKNTKRSIWGKSLFALLSIGIVSLSNTSMNAQNIGTYQIGSGTNTINGGTAMPVTNYDYTYSQQIIKASEISNAGGVTGNITKIKYYVKTVGTASVWDTWTVYMGNTLKDAFESESDYIPLGELTNVYSGTITAVNESWMEVTLTTPFNYTGGNLVVAVHETKLGWTTAPTFYSYNSTNAGILFRRDTSVIDPSNIPTGTTNKYRVSSVPQLRFEGAVNSCLAPLQATVNNVTTTSANISWDGDNTGTYEVQYGLNGFALGTGAISTSQATSLVLQTLTSGSNYQYYIRKVCSDYTTAWSGPFSFSTLCEAFGTLTENFDTVATGSSTSLTKPNCWSTIFTGTGYGYVSTTYSVSPSKSYYLYNNSDNTGSTMLISPVMENLGTGTMRVKFKARAGGANYTLLFGTMSNATVASTFTQLQSYTLTTTFQEFTVVLPAGSDDYFAFKHGNGGTYRGIYIDDVIYEALPSCMEPLSLTSTNATTTSINLSWTGTNGETGTYEIRYGVPGFVIDEATSITVTGQSYQISISQPGSYEYVVRQVCTGENSSWSLRKAFRIFNIGEDCGAPIIVASLPYITTDNTSNYIDNPAIEGSPGASGCGSTSSYLNGNDVVYKYTSTFNGTLKVTLSALSASWSGIFAYNSCSDIGVNCIAGVANSGNANRVFELPVTIGEDYYFVISTWADPQTVGYTLSISELTCPTPTNVTTGTSTLNSTQISWNGAADGSYEINWGIGTFAAGEGANSQTTTGTTYTIQGLNPSTNYRYFVRRVCGADGQSDWMGPYTFATQLAPAQAPWIEDFATTSIPVGWTLSTLTVQETNARVPNLDGAFIAGNLYGTYPSGTFTTLPITNIQSGFKLSFNYLISDWDYYPAQPSANSLSIAVKISTNDGLSYTTLETITNDGTTEGWQNFEYDVTSYVGETIKIQVTTTRSSGDFMIAFDNVSVLEPPCNAAAPTGAATQTLVSGQTLADLEVTGTSITWYSDAALTTVIPASTIAVNGTTYYATQTIDSCESETALAITVTVEEPCNTAAPTGDSVQSLSQGQTLADLQVTGTNLKWYSDSALMNEIASTTVATTGTTYYVTQTIDSCESTSALAITVDVALDNNSLDIVDLKVYPNPTSDVLNIDYKTVITKVSIFDINGRQVGSYELNATTNSISVDALSSGTYLLKIQTEANETSIVKFVKK